MSWKDLFRRKKALKQPVATAKSESRNEADSKQTDISQKAENDERLSAAKQQHREGKIAEAEAVRHCGVLARTAERIGEKHEQ